MTDINKSKANNARRKNGHKMSCSCHICDNIRNKEQKGGYADDLRKENEKKMGLKKKNGHSSTCNCVICQNMNNAKNKTTKLKISKRNKKKINKSHKNRKVNGHKMDCKCPICKNMANKIKNK